jgi:predicted site-specific integrase-resolvase
LKGGIILEIVSIGKFAKMLGVSQITLRRMHESGELIPYRISKGGTRYYSTDQLKELSGLVNDSRIVVGYCRVSTNSQKDDLEKQIENLRNYMCAKGYQFEIIQDIGSGINYRKDGLRKLIQMVHDNKVSKVVVLYKDRLIRFGFDLIEYICQLNNTEIEIVDNKQQSLEQELSDDLIQIVTVFANRLYGSRSKRTKNLIEEVKRNASQKENTA